MKEEISKKRINGFNKAFNEYKVVFDEFNKLDKNSQEKINKKLYYIESESSVKIEKVKYAN